MFENNIGKSTKHYIGTHKVVGGALQDYNLVFLLKKQVDCYRKMFIETKKLETQINNMGNE
jgi:hypothetical protein